MQQIRAAQLAEWLADGGRPQPVLLDVREDWELDICRLDKVVHMPMHTVPQRVGELDPEDEIVVICHHGVRSLQVAMFLERQGHQTVINLNGGMAAWADEVDPAMRRY